MIDSVPYRFPTAEERWPRQGSTMPYSFPKLVIEEHEGFHIVRDDLLEGGSKRRFVDRMIREEIAEGAEEFVYGGCPANGYAQLSLTLQAKAYGKKAIFFPLSEPTRIIEEGLPKLDETSIHFAFLRFGIL